MLQMNLQNCNTFSVIISFNFWGHIVIYSLSIWTTFNSVKLTVYYIWSLFLASLHPWQQMRMLQKWRSQFTTTTSVSFLCINNCTSLTLTNDEWGFKLQIHLIYFISVPYFGKRRFHSEYLFFIHFNFCFLLSNHIELIDQPYPIFFGEAPSTAIIAE